MTKGVSPSSGNVFEDLGFSPEEAENVRVRAVLMVSLRQIIEDAGITQAQAAEAFGVTQPRVSDLVRGKIEAVQYRHSGEHACRRGTPCRGLY